jgi:hypothetical protein
MRSVMASWTEERVKRLKLLQEERLSATVIATKLGPDFTKGRVLGKLRRQRGNSVLAVAVYARAGRFSALTLS